MNAPTPSAPISAATSLALVLENPVLAFTEEGRADAFLTAIRAEIDAHVPDLSTDKGRKAIASLAHKVSKSKVALVDAGKALVEDQKAAIAKVDRVRLRLAADLDVERDRARKPLTDWEAAEEARAAAAKAITDGIRQDGVVSMDDTSETVASRIESVRAIELTEAQFGESLPIASGLKRNVIEALEAAKVRLEREEADRAELAKLRAAEEERLRQAEADRIAAEAKAAQEREEANRKEAAARAAREAEERAEAERKRIADAAAAAERAAIQKAEREAAEARAAQERAHAEALAAERRRADEAEAARKAEADRIARDQAEREATAKAEADAQAAREKDRAHKGRVMLAAKTTIMSLGVGEATAKAIVLAIAAGEVPAVSIQF